MGPRERSVRSGFPNFRRAKFEKRGLRGQGFQFPALRLRAHVAQALRGHHLCRARKSWGSALWAG
eukprot:7871055-Pyramimonas_sp.AAC.1